MRPVLLALALGAALCARAAAQDLRPFDDAPLHAVAFVDAREGWAVGDEGVVWHTIDGGKTWERQPTGVRASLRGVQFLNPYTGWVAGREELPGGGSAGVLLFTRDGGLKWQRVTLNALPGLNRVRFLDNKTGFLAGDCTDQHPSGVFATSDSGRTWAPLAGPRGTSWLAADFSDPQTGALGGAWNRLAMMRRDTVVMVDEDTLGGRSLRGLQLAGKMGFAVGHGGLVLVNEDTSKPVWGYADLKLPAEVRAGWDFHAVACLDRHVWVAGRPGSVLLHSPNRGGTWEVVRTRQPLPLNGVFFLDEQHGWAVGEFGAILATEDGGKTWEVQRRGGGRAAVLLVHARPGGVPLETVAGLGGDEGYLTAAVRVVAPDPATAAPARSAEAHRFAAAVRSAGGGAGESLWQFPLPQHLAGGDKAALLKGWDGRHGGRAAEELLRQLVLALRVWRPEVVVTDAAAGADATPADALIVEAVRAAFDQAADEKAFPEQVEQLGLQPWKAGKLYARSEAKGQVVFDATEALDRLGASPRDFAEPAAGLIAEGPAALPTQRHYTLLAARMEGAASHRSLMQGVMLAPGGEARRALGEAVELTPERRKAIYARRNLKAVAELPADGLGDGNKLLAQVGPALESLSEEQGAPAAFAIAQQYARAGQWALAREVMRLTLERYPAHPLSAEACRWLIRHAASSEARRRQELGQYLVLQTVSYEASAREREGAMPGADGELIGKPPGKPTGPIRFETKTPDLRLAVVADSESGVMQDRAATRRWYEGGLALEPKLASFGPLFSNDPATLFSLHAARRSLGDFDEPRKWYAKFSSRQPAGPWRDAAQAELWLVNRTGAAPRPVAPCRQTEARPFLDGKLDDPCWQAMKPLPLLDAGRGKKDEARLRQAGLPADDLTAEYPTEVYLAYDREYLYLGLRCRHPAERHVAPVKVRPRDPDLRPYDRVSLMLDLDRDYATYFHLQIDQRGCVSEEFCQDGARDRSWNPRWFVACHSGRDGWQAEAALPLAEVTGDPVTIGKAWACNVVRVVPGRGVQALSLPADAEPRGEGMGLLMFTPDTRRAAADGVPSMPRVP
jgi:photosystem II stability/assembly factor-like uncharacterized protein